MQVFWDIDTKLLDDRSVKVKYGGKNFVRYRTRNGVFAEAVSRPGSIEWRIRTTRVLQTESQSADVLMILREAAKAG